MREVDAEKDEDKCGDTPAGRLTHSLLMQTASQRASANRRRQDSREYRCVFLSYSALIWIVFSLVLDHFLGYLSNIGYHANVSFHY